MATNENAILARRGQPFEGVHVLCYDAPILELYGPSLLQLSEGTAYGNPLAACHGG